MRKKKSKEGRSGAAARRDPHAESRATAGTFRPFHDLRKLVVENAPAPPSPEPPRPQPRATGGGRAEGEGDGGGDDDLFGTAMRGVDVAVRPTLGPRGEGPPVPPAEDESAIAERFLSAIVDGDLPFEFSDTTEYIEGSVRGLDSRILRRLRIGELAVEGHLDLHGLDRGAAKRAVREFVERCQEDGKRCVLVIHGRGLGSKDHVPVLKENLRDWLTRGGIGRRVLAYTSARPCDGGAGAAYVLLRRLSASIRK